jgi:hypothetical protein
VLFSSAFILLISTPAYSASFLQASGKNWEIGVGSYAVIVEKNNEREEFGGGSFFASLIFNDHFSIRGSYYSLENTDRDYLDLSGYEVNAYMGEGLQSTGLKAYAGVGLYSETLTYRSTDNDISGAQISGGIGYNWSNISLDFTVSVRTVGDYADYFDKDEDSVTAAGGSLSIAYRF